MPTFTDDKRKHGYVIPSHPQSSGSATIYIEGYPSEDDEPMAATQFHARQIVTLSYQLEAFFGWEERVYVGTDTLIYYREDRPTRKVAPDVVFALVRELFARIARHMMADGRVHRIERLEAEVGARSKQRDRRCVHCGGNMHGARVVRNEKVTMLKECC